MLRPICGWIALAALWAGPATSATPSTEPSRVTDEAALPAEYQLWQRGFDAAMLEHAQALAARGDARSLLAAAMIAPTHFDEASGPALPTSADRQAWFDAARAARPADPLVAWLEAIDCPTALQCDADAAVARLLQVDGDNAAAQWLAINAALDGGDATAARTHLRLAAQADRFEPYAGEVLALLLDARNAAPLAPIAADTADVLGADSGLGRPARNDDLIAMRSIAEWAAIALPPMSGVMRLCRPGEEASARDTALQQDCASLLAHAAADDSVMVFQAWALPALVERSSGRERSAWQAQLREFAWLYEQAARLLPPNKTAATAGLADYAHWIAADGELGAMRKLMQLNHVPLEPPTGWLPTQPGYRALVTRGSAPAA